MAYAMSTQQYVSQAMPTMTTMPGAYQAAAMPIYTGQPVMMQQRMMMAQAPMVRYVQAAPQVENMQAAPQMVEYVQQQPQMVEYVQQPQMVKDGRYPAARYSQKRTAKAMRQVRLQDRTRRAEIEEGKSASERLHHEADAESQVMGQLTTQLEKEKQRKRRYEAHETAAAQINPKRPRMEMQADIDAKTLEIERLTRINACAKRSILTMDNMLQEKDLANQELEEEVRQLKQHQKSREEEWLAAAKKFQGGSDACGGRGDALILPPFPSQSWNCEGLV